MRFHHIGLIVRDVDRALMQYAGLFGASAVGEPVEDAACRARFGFVTVPGGPRIALVEPIEQGPEACPFLYAGASSYICFEVDDLALAIAEARAEGAVLIVEPAPAPALGQRRAAVLWLPVCCLVQYVEARLEPQVDSAC